MVDHSGRQRETREEVGDVRPNPLHRSPLALSLVFLLYKVVAQSLFAEVLPMIDPNHPPFPLQNTGFDSALPGLWPPDYGKTPNKRPNSSLKRGASQHAQRAVATTHVHAPETKCQPMEYRDDWGAPLTPSDPPVIFRHSGWARQRSRIGRALESTGASDRVITRFSLCGADPWVCVSEDDPSRVTIQSNHCHSRWCVPCSRERGNRIVTNLKVQLHTSRVRFLTLTLKHSDTPLKDQIDRIYSSFRALRRARIWRVGVTGGCAVLEIKHSHHDNLWHVHLHCLIQGHYMRRQDLSAEWLRVTGDSYIIDIRDCKTPEIASRYVCKYITKPVPTTVINKGAQLVELLQACRGRRLALTFGNWRGIRLSAPIDTTKWRTLVPLPVLLERADGGDSKSVELLRCLERNIPRIRDIAGRSPPEDPQITQF